MSDSCQSEMYLVRSIIEQFPGLIVAMDSQSRFIYSNDYTAQLFGYTDQERMIGLNAFNMRCPAVESATDFIQQDLWVNESQKELDILDIHTYANGEAKILLTKKKPFKYHEGQSGTICFCTEVQSETLKKVCMSIIQSDTQFHSRMTNRSYMFGETGKQTTLTKREEDCLFYLLRGQTMKQIAQSMDVSWRTVETHKQNIKHKWQCYHDSQIVERGIAEGYLNYIPENILKKNISHWYN